jgi:glutathione S-transferase
LYGAPISPFVRKVRMILALKRIDYELHPIDVFAQPDWFKEISPLRRVPVLKDRERNGATLADSSAIAHYLDLEHPTPALLPRDDAWAQARAVWLEEYADTEFSYRLGMGIFRNRFVNPRQGKPVDEALAQKTLNETAPRYFSYFEQELGGDLFFLGDRMSLADIAVATQFVNFRYGGEAVDAGRWPRLAAFVGRMFALPEFAALLAEEARELGLPA